LDSSRKPLRFLSKHLNEKILVRLKDGYKLRGLMIGCDNNMNLILEDASYYLAEEPIVKYSSLIIRGSYIDYIRVKEVD
jgi:small nuclear ribonucleoprotein (snRNP)-like protein